MIEQTDPRGDFYKTTYVYDKLDRMESMSGPSGTPENPKPYTIRFSYDAIGNTLEVTDPRGRGLKTVKTYDRAGRLETSTDQAENVTRYEYDEADNLIKQTSPAVSDQGPQVLSMTYDVLGHQSGIRDALGHLTCTQMDDNGQVIALVNPRAGLTSCGNAISATSYVTRKFYDGEGQKIAEVDAENNRTEWEYDAVGHLKRFVDPRTFSASTPGVFDTVYEYDKRGHVQSITESIGLQGNNEVAVHKYQYDALGLLRSYTDPRGDAYKTTYDYDALHHLTTTQQSFPSGTEVTQLTARTVYDALGNLISKTDPRGEFYTTRYTYDALNRSIDTISPTGTPDNPGPLDISTNVRDEVGNVIELRDPRGAYYTTTWRYDAINRVEHISMPTGSAERPSAPALTDYTYYPGGNVHTVTMPAVGQTGTRPVVTTTYNVLGLPTLVVDEIGARTETSYDEAGNTILITQLPQGTGAARVTKLEYDKLDRLVKVTDPGNFETRTTYDAVGNKTRVEGPFFNQNGIQTTSYVYDARDKVRSITDAEGHTTRMQYDVAGNQIKLVDPRGSWADIDYTYDGANRLIRVDQPTGTESASSPKATTRMEYDSVGNLVKQIDARGANFATTYERDARGNVVARHVAGGTPGNIQTLTWKTSYDVVGNVIEEIDARGAQYRTTYERDFAGNILSATYPVLSSTVTSVTEQNQYDASGNLLRSTGIGGSDYVTTFDYDLRGRMIQRIDPVGDKQTIEYDRYNNVVKKTDYLGTSLFEFDSLDRMRKTTDALGNEVNYIYSQGGLDLQTISPHNHTTTERRDRLGRVVEVMDALGFKEQTTYDAAGNAIQYIDKAGTRSTVSYDARNLPVVETAAVGTPVQTAIEHRYDALGREIATTDPRGEFYTTTFAYDNLGRVIEQRMRAGNEQIAGVGTPGEGQDLVERWSYDVLGRTLSHTPARGDFYRTDYTVDGMGRVLTVSKQTGTPVNPERVTVEHRYDKAGNKIYSRDELGFETERTYDRVGRIKTETIAGTGPGTGTSSWNYVDTAEGFRIESYNRDNQLEQAVDYDALGRVVTIDNLTGNDVQKEYDKDLLHKVTEGTKSIVYTYDELDRMASQADEQLHTMQYRYDAVGNLKSVRDKDNFETKYEYDRLNRRRAVEDPLSGRTLTDYDAAGNVIAITSPGGDRTTMEVDSRGQTLTETTSDGVRHFEYDADGNLVRSIDRNGREIRRTYDGNNLQTSESWLVGNSIVHTLTMDYDAGGRKRSSTEGSVTNTWNYVDNAAYWLSGTSVSFTPTSTATLQYQRRSSGEKSVMSVSVNGSSNVMVNTYNYNPQTLRLESIRQTGSFASDKSVGFTYQANMLALDSITRSAGSQVVSTTTFGLDVRSQVNHIKHQSNSSVINEYTLTYNNNGLIDSVTDRYDRRVYSYDQLKQLSGVTHTDPDLSAEVYAWDSDGNRIVSTHQGTSVETDANNRIRTDGTFDYQYDDEGNRILATRRATGEQIRYTWDHRNRLTEVSYHKVSGEETAFVQYGYDAENRRVTRLADDDLTDNKPAKLTRFIYDGDDVVLELVDSHALDGVDNAVPYVAYLLGSGTDQIFAQDFGTGNYQWLLADASGTIADVIARDGLLLDHIQYDAFGRILQRVDPSVAVAICSRVARWTRSLVPITSVLANTIRT